MSCAKSRRTPIHFLFAVNVLALLLFMPQSSQAVGRSGNVYVPTNQTTGNSILVFHRDPAGVLTFAASFPTGGIGAGTGADPLASQGAVVLSGDNRLLFAVNAGSNSVSTFAISGDRLTLLGAVPSGGSFPVSLTVRDNLVYVLNASGTPNISGFTIQPATNLLIPLPGSIQNLPGGATAGPAQVGFSPDGSVLVVTEKSTNLIDTFVVDQNGVTQPGTFFSSSGTTPFGFDFGHDNVAIVSNVGSGPAASSLSSYTVGENGNLNVVTSALGDTQTAACWVVVPRNGHFAYTANSGSGTISSYAVAEDGSPELLKVVAASTAGGAVPIDMALSDNSRFLYVRNGGNGTISGFRIEADGSLTSIATISGVPPGAQGIASR
ncbi:MAG TPA: beta-propeller fold lactonase family protein [Terriglobia bacterium]|nr:beta-propeller fold lactonase family protein [Terriglobia bacterium]